MSPYKTDLDIIRKIQTGKGDETFMTYAGKALYIELIFGGTTPINPEQDYIEGNNNLFSAAAARWGYEIDALKVEEGFSISWSIRFAIFFQKALHEWGLKNEYLGVTVFSNDAWEDSFVSDITGDVAYLSIAVLLVSTYSFFVLGNLSPVHFRSCTAIIGMGCVFLGVTSGYAMAFFMTLKTSNFHNILPFMVIGIGVDDMFVIVYSVDQTPQHLKADDRFRIGFTHAGPSITITKLTSALAFFFGAYTSLTAL